MGERLGNHKAGEPLGKEDEIDRFFRRHTDRVVKRNFDCNPLEVGANLIARTAYQALDSLRMIGKEIPVLTGRSGEDALTPPASAIEVYPAATLEAHSILNRGYKSGEEAEQKREQIIKDLPDDLKISDEHTEAAISSDHILDSIVCVLAGVDYLEGNVIDPEAKG